ncbi:hypothetical protein UA08_05063 [Talaromyces atroroseus]|uniref:Uncharacterized protein n=1 Tax=Talaromyces atroroseus TaxID=1441469 RepID=A0A225AY85_TALAT|nr:hypothetical protein UA08_05063 [Talaromyces atroroseus]OKL59425.1 hypothetical protein UA08_05063 [Talaromyces atroroseus]
MRRKKAFTWCRGIDCDPTITPRHEIGIVLLLACAIVGQSSFGGRGLFWATPFAQFGQRRFSPTWMIAQRGRRRPFWILGLHPGTTLRAAIGHSYLKY